VLALTFPAGLFVLKGTPGRSLQFLDDGRFFVLADGKRIVEGTYGLMGDIYIEESNYQGCPAPRQFNWTFDFLKLKFQPMRDNATNTCEGTKGVFNETNLWEAGAVTFPFDMYKGCTSTYCGQ